MNSEIEKTSSTYKPKKHKVLRGCLLTALILIVLIILGREIFIRYNIFYAKENPTSIPASFSESLYKHDYRMAKALTDPQIWSQIQGWLDKNEQVECPLIPILIFGDEGQGDSIVTMITDEVETFYIGHSYMNIVCPEPKHYYCLEVTDIIIKQEEEQWVITEVGNLEQYWSEYNCN
jgi:hypothetical protein